MKDIICRLDPFKAIPVVFLVESYVPASKEIKAWREGEEVQPVSFEYYRTTLPLSNADELLISERYIKATGTKDVTVRHRLPRIRRELANVFATDAPVSPATATQGADDHVPGEPDLKAAMAALQAEMADKMAAIQRAMNSKKK